MPISLGVNISSLRSQRELLRATDEIGTVFERLSSGQRINRAADDAAGLSIADSLKAKSRVYTQGVRNLNDGLSALQIADGALAELSEITTRLIELAEQSANGSLNNTQRTVLDEEAQSLRDEYLRIIQSTEFNGQQVLGSDFGDLRIQAGYGVDGGIASSLGGVVGDGTFYKASSNTTESTFSSEVELADFNNDGILDMVTAGFSGAGELTVLLGDGEGGFSELASYSVNGTLARDVDIADINGDGIMDLAAVGTGISGAYTILLGQGDGTFVEASTATTETNGTYSVALGDVNNDGIMDLVTGGIESGASRGHIYLGAGDGTFTEYTDYAPGGTLLYDVDLNDLDNDGTLDIVASTNGASVVTLLGDGDGGFSSSGSGGPSQVYSSAVGDFNGDGILDYVASNASQISVFLGDGTGTFTESATYAAEGDGGVEVGDLNGDGLLDIATVGDNGSGELNIFLGAGDGTFSAGETYTTESVDSNGLALGDLNQDGVLDIVTAGDSGPGEASVFLSNTTSGTSPLLEFSLGTMADARQALPLLQQKIDQLATQRGEIGAFMSRVNVAERVLSVSAETSRSAESLIRDTDIAVDAANLVRLQIKQQASTAILAQANLQSSLVIGLLQGQQ